MPTKNPYSFKAKVVQRSKGQSATASAAYQAGEKIADRRTGRQHNYSKKKGVVHTEILAPNPAPGWARSRAELWNRAELVERRKDAQIARKFILALPRQLADAQRVEYTRTFIQEQFVSRGMVADYSIHDPDPGKNQDNYHLHLLTTMRIIGPEGFGDKNRAWNKTSLLETWREQWAVHTNRALMAQGFEPTWDHRTLEEQGESRVPQVHLGQAVLEMEAKGIQTKKGQRALEIARANQLQEELEEIEKEINNYDERTRTNSKISQPSSTDRGIAATTPERKPTNHPTPSPGGGHGQGSEKASATTLTLSTKTQKPARPTVESVNLNNQGGTEDMLSAAEYQEFLRVRRLMAQRQEEEKQQRRLSEEQKKRIEEMILRTEEAALKRPDFLYWEDYFAMDCLSELRKRKQTVEQADWLEIEGKVATGLLMDGATVKDVGEILSEKGVGAVLDPGTPPDGQTAGERLALEYLKTLAASNPDLLDAVEQAEKRQEAEARNAQREQMQEAQNTAPQPGA